MQEFIARANIARFIDLIAKERDGAARELLERMLAEERVNLKRALGAPLAGDPPASHPPPPA